MPVSISHDTDDDRMKQRDRLLDEIDKSFKLQMIRLQLLKEKLCESLAQSKVSDLHDCKENCINEGEDYELCYGDDGMKHGLLSFFHVSTHGGLLLMSVTRTAAQSLPIFSNCLICQADNHHSIGDETERDDDVKACFPCPFCYLEIEIHMICSHLQEHCFDLKHAVCPLCAANLGKDAAEHFIVQHGSSLKRRRKSLKSGFWNGGSAMLGKELSSFIGSSTIGRGNAHESLPDPLLSPFLCSGLISDTKGIQKDDCSQEVYVPSDLKSVERTLLDNEHEENVEEKRQRATFVQQLIMSTVF